MTLAELTRLAGWAEGTWDRMVHVPADATAAELNAASGISDFCWSNMPQSWSISVEQTIRDGNLLFVPGTTPLQSVFVSDISRTIELGDNPLEVVHPNTLLTPKDHYSGRRLTTVE
ncbi:hypothetical protein JK358_15745 [Nocardia sp. 2]|uniref:Uncharacterized protein n=1 Tax=Nocardia acididurans TaxID=2802282 RepID=A0ABS1M7U9_9NOCA|nr:hypothetical protein [Nocardia acididurans]MBL1075849.1 hypothetical protein [Nocardia acididurans]